MKTKFIKFAKALVNTAAVRKVVAGKLASGSYSIELHLLGDESYEVESFRTKSAREKRLRVLMKELSDGSRL